MEKREFILGKDVSMLSGQAVFPEPKIYADNSPIMTVGGCVCVGLNIMSKSEDGDIERIRVYMDKTQAKAMIKGLKQAMRGLK